MTKDLLRGIQNYEDIVSIEEIKAGFSSDRKMLICLNNGQKLVARISDISRHERKQEEFNILREVNKTGISMSQPIAFGVLEDQSHVYQLVTYVPGHSAEEKLPLLSLDEQYHIGFSTGQMLKKIHQIALTDQNNWTKQYTEKIQRKIREHRQSQIVCPIIDRMIDYLFSHLHLLNNRPTSLCHGDYHVGNTILDHHNKPFIIDFNRFAYEDPWSEFNSLFFSYRVSPLFAKGQIEGYFDQVIPAHFFPLLKLYTVVNAVSSLAWASQFSEEDVAFMRRSVERIYDEYDHLSCDIPKWYGQLL